MTGLVALATAAFVGTHFLLSHPLRRPVVGTLGEGGFRLLYSAVAAVTLGAAVWAYLSTPPQPPLWPVGDGLWALATVGMLGAAVLLMGSLVGNPAMIGARPGSAPGEARGVFAVTRHPMMWSFALWSVCHALVFPVPGNLVITAGILVLSLVGATLQDRKKALQDPAGWAGWVGRTSYWPFAAMAAGRARPGRWGMHTLAGGFVLWLLATWVHIPLAGWPAGIWRWVG